MTLKERLSEIDTDKLPFWSIFLFALPSAKREYSKLIDILVEYLNDRL